MGRSASPLLRLIAVLAAAVLWPIGVPARADGPPLGTFRYTVSHPTFGTIGTYTNTIARDGDRIIVDTEVRVLVRMLVMTLRRIDADRREVWVRGRLVGYRSVTRRNGRVISVNGYAEGDRFVIDGPYGHATAPASVYPGNPWSIGILHAPVIMGPETGRLYNVTFTGGAEETIMAAGRPVRARHYIGSSDRRPNLWYDQNGIPVQFSIVDEGSVITCTLASMSPPTVARDP